MNTMLRHTAIFTAVALLLAFAPTTQAQVEWTHHPTPVLEAQDDDRWDALSISAPTVIRAEGDTLKMWYSGSNDSPPPSASSEIGYAWSLDGVSWTRYLANPVLTPEGGGNADVPRVLADGDVLRMWYAEGDLSVPDYVIRYATSSDGGVTWDRHPTPVMVPGPAGTWNETAVSPGDVVKEDGLFKM